MTDPEKCPVCHSTNTTTEHLIDEYFSMMRASFGTFKRNATIAQNEVADMLLRRGVTHAPNIFGPIRIEKSSL